MEPDFHGPRGVFGIDRSIAPMFRFPDVNPHVSEPSDPGPRDDGDHDIVRRLLSEWGAHRRRSLDEYVCDHLDVWPAVKRRIDSD